MWSQIFDDCGSGVIIIAGRYSYEDIKKTFNQGHWGEDEKNTFLCLREIIRNQPITQISKTVGVSNAFVLISAFLVLGGFCLFARNF